MQSGMSTPEILETLGTQDTRRKQTKHKNTTQKARKMSDANPIHILNRVLHLNICYSYC